MVLDPAPLEALRSVLGEEAPTVIARVVSSFSADSKKDVQSLEEAVTGADASRAFSLAHGLKGLCGTVGAARAGHFASEITELARDGALGGVEPLVTQLRASIEAAIAELTRTS